VGLPACKKETGERCGKPADCAAGLTCSADYRCIDPSVALQPPEDATTATPSCEALSHRAQRLLLVPYMLAIRQDKTLEAAWCEMTWGVRDCMPSFFERLQHGGRGGSRHALTAAPPFFSAKDVCRSDALRRDARVCLTRAAAAPTDPHARSSPNGAPPGRNPFDVAHTYAVWLETHGVQWQADAGWSGILEPPPRYPNHRLRAFHECMSQT